MILVGLALAQTTTLLTDFVTYPYITSVTEQELNFSNHNVELPSLTVCNLNPLSDRAYTNHDVISFQRYTEKIQAEMDDHLTSIENLKNAITMQSNQSVQLMKERLKLMQKFLARMYQRYESLGGYHSYILPQNARDVGHTQEEFIARCKILFRSGLDMGEGDCSKLGTITMLPHAKYFNCYTIQVGEQLPDEIIIGYSVTLHLRNYGNRWYSFVKDQRQARLGGLVALHQPGT